MSVTPLTKLCDRCKRRIKLTALSCVCGWSAASAEATYNREAHIDCCFSGCPESAIASVWTKTGWANVCEKDYPRLEYTKRPQTNNAVCNAIREAYAKSRGKKIEGHISERLPERIPGSDDELEAA